MKKYALVAGASSGIGREYVRQRARRGYAVLSVSEQRLVSRIRGRQRG